MLVLSRKESEKINIGNGIVITVTKIKGSSVRLGIEAPEDVHIRRGELPCLFQEEVSHCVSRIECVRSQCCPVKLATLAWSMIAPCQWIA